MLLQVSLLISELAASGQAELGIQLDEGTVERLLAYSPSVADFPTAVKEVMLKHIVPVLCSCYAHDILMPSSVPISIFEVHCCCSQFRVDTFSVLLAYSGPVAVFPTAVREIMPTLCSCYAHAKLSPYLNV